MEDEFAEQKAEFAALTDKILRECKQTSHDGYLYSFCPECSSRRDGYKEVADALFAAYLKGKSESVPFTITKQASVTSSYIDTDGHWHWQTEKG